MRSVLLFVMIWFVCSSINYSSNVRPVFGVRVSIGANSRLTTYVCYLHNGRTLTHKRVMDEGTFVKTISGHWPSVYNPKRINYFKENSIDCDILTDSITRKKIPVCVPFDSLWKIRFSTYPFRHKSAMGWSNNYHKPSLKQQKYISDRYGVDHIDGDFFLDTSFWLLMNDVMDPEWIKNYKSIK